MPSDSVCRGALFPDSLSQSLAQLVVAVFVATETDGPDAVAIKHSSLGLRCVELVDEILSASANIMREVFHVINSGKG